MTEKAQVTVEELDPLAFVDYVFGKLGLPKPGPLLRMFAPKTILEALGIKTLDEITEEALDRIHAELKKRRII